MIAALLPCPFCGHEHPEFERMGDRRQSCIVICGNCGARHESGDEGSRNGSSWNQRSEPGQDGLRATLETALARIEDMLADDDGQAFKEARKFVEAARQLSEQPGFVMVPVEPTPAMLVAMWDHRESMRGQSENRIARAGYTAMLAARPLTAAPIPEASVADEREAWPAPPIGDHLRLQDFRPTQLEAAVMKVAAKLSDDDKRKLVNECGFVTGPNYVRTTGVLYRSLGTQTNVWERDLFALIDAARAQKGKA